MDTADSDKVVLEFPTDDGPAKPASTSRRNDSAELVS